MELGQRLEPPRAGGACPHRIRLAGGGGRHEEIGCQRTHIRQRHVVVAELGHAGARERVRLSQGGQHRGELSAGRRRWVIAQRGGGLGPHPEIRFDGLVESLGDQRQGGGVLEKSQRLCGVGETVAV